MRRVVARHFALVTGPSEFFSSRQTVVRLTPNKERIAGLKGVPGSQSRPLF